VGFKRKGAIMAMEIFTYAIELKKEKEAFYRQLSHEGIYDGVKRLFSLLADEEARHREAIEEMETSINVKLAKTTIKRDAKQIFDKIRADVAQNLSAFEHRTLKLYHKALQYEEKAEKFYQQKSEEVTDSCQHEIFKNIAIQEHEHREIIETIIDFVSKPERWLENAEWYHLSEY
jgi:rubrerythrin